MATEMHGCFDIAKPAAERKLPCRPKNTKKHKFTGLEDTETPSSAAPATYQPPTQEQVNLDPF